MSKLTTKFYADKMEENTKYYDRDFKIKAVLLSFERNAIAQVARELEIKSSLLYLWRVDYKKLGVESFPGFGNLRLTTEQKRLQQLEKKIKESELKFEILKNGAEYLNKGKPFIFHFIKINEKKHPITLMCRVLNVNRGTYRSWEKQVISERQKWRIDLKKEIRSIFFACKERYGCHRIAIELQNSGYNLSHSTVLKYMRELELSSKIKKELRPQLKRK